MAMYILSAQLNYPFPYIGLLDKHRQMLEEPFRKDKIDVKDMYLELIKMIMDQEAEQWPKGHEQTKDIHKLQNYQELTNRLVVRIVHVVHVRNFAAVASQLQQTDRNVL